MVKKNEYIQRNKTFAVALLFVGAVWSAIWISALLTSGAGTGKAILPLACGALILALGWGFYVFRYKVKAVWFLSFLLIATLGIAFILVVLHALLHMILYGL